ncbi:MAG TPA: TonB family protein [Novosphingobium sp.]|nr:TonB family protein [Novosphingobium sp.]
MAIATWTGSERGFGTSPFGRVNLGGMGASVAAHALVLALLAMTWGEETLIEGGTRSALVSIDLAAQEGGPGKTKAPPRETPDAAVKPPPPTMEAQPISRPSPEPSAAVQPPAQERPGGGGAGRTGQGTGIATIHPTPVASPVPVRATVSPASAATAAEARPAHPAAGADQAADERGTGGSGGGRTDQAGNSSASNFKGLVFQHLYRHRGTNSVGSAKVLVGFTIDPDGSARDIAVVRSSGVPLFDRQALQLVRRAVPFPRPPDRAARRLVCEITG